MIEDLSKLANMSSSRTRTQIKALKDGTYRISIPGSVQIYMVECSYCCSRGLATTFGGETALKAKVALKFHRRTAHGLPFEF